ncbi:zf-HC2 domain-containing protein [Acrocarpospora catenulata]|uniref:zf-HC2 domain-containing protein n=1 Tax=Acrocarpospora catenulata TaxID=2836182 RepID=UPI001BD956C1|nr:zf-HC2 domain-containing protein [Acrocarpospora catenulata]
MSDWHVDDDLAARYAGGDLGGTTAASVEAHLLACERCRGSVAAAVPAERLERLWQGIAEVVDAPVPGPFERLLRLLRIEEPTARLLGVTYSLRWPWLAANAVSLLFAVYAAGVNDRWGLLSFLALAPVLPVAGVALAFGRGADPAYEIGLAAPYSVFRLMLMRAAAVLVTSAVLAFAAGFAFLGNWVAVAWLLPALALTTLTLVLSSRFDPVYAGSALALLWLAGISVFAVRDQPLAMFGAAGQVTALAVALVAAALLFLRRDRYQSEES